ncbi:putative adenosine kinase [Trypanosoma grayi]|uniref:putative adenosine kinase n=1 Tax=Trypanosoma grayi TaxID=71804 RepID=UPI0004F42EB8|nr:putative adenosine kinase [Trypanosoma grayi]KEG08766.1 putative adenosine kinase [Trypanosoma grayi]
MVEKRVVEPTGSGALALFFGQPLFDMTANASEELLAQYGIRDGSVGPATPEQLPIFEQLLNEEDTTYYGGGSAMNAGRTMKWVSPETDVCCVGSVGCDEFCEVFTRTMDEAGVHYLLEYHEDSPTGTCVALIVNKERAMRANLGAANKITLEYMKSAPIQRAIKKAMLFYTEGFFLNTVSSPENVLLLAEHAHKEGKLFCFNLNAPFVSLLFGERLKVLLPFIDILFGGREDFTAFGTMMWGDEVGSDIDAVLMRTVGLPKNNSSRSRLVVATCGADPTLVAMKHRVTAYEVPEVDKAQIVDLTGAGDCFVGGFLAQYLSCPDIQLCVEAGHAAAAVVIRHWGTRLSGDPPQLKTRNGEFVC